MNVLDDYKRCVCESWGDLELDCMQVGEAEIVNNHGISEDRKDYE